MRLEKNNYSLKRENITPHLRGLENPKTEQLENCVYEDGKIKNRIGTKINENGNIFYRDGSFDADMYLDVTDCYVCLEGRYGRVAISISDNMMDNITFYMKLCFSDGGVKDIGIIEFIRVSYDLFGRPDSYTVFSGKGIKGCGIFLMVRQVYSGAAEDMVKVYELSEAMNSWILLNSSDIYLPCVLANGRGESYFAASFNGERLEFPEPVKPEGKNLLNPAFISCYSTDSVSSRFYLPYTDIDNSAVICEYKGLGYDCRWVIPADKDNSDEVEIDGARVKALCDRQSGLVYFKKTDGTDYALSYAGKLNNLKITASKTELSQMVRAASKTAACRPLSDSGFYSSGVTFFYGGWLHPAEVLWNSPRHPLYFSENNIAVLGEAQLEVTKMTVTDKKLAAFKENRLFIGDLKRLEGGRPTEASIELGAQDRTDIIDIGFSQEIAFPEKPIEKSIALSDGEIIFVSEKGSIFKIYGATPTLKRITDRKFTASNTAFGIVFAGRYLLINGRKAEVLEKRADGDYIIGEWSFAENIIDGFEYLGDTVLFARLHTDDINLVYAIVPNGDTDEYYTAAFGIVQKNSRNIASKIALKIGDGKPMLLHIEKIKVDADTHGRFSLHLKDGGKEIYKAGILPKGERGYALPSKTVYDSSVELRFENPFVLNSIAVEYRKLNKI